MATRRRTRRKSSSSNFLPLLVLVGVGLAAFAIVSWVLSHVLVWVTLLAAGSVGIWTWIRLAQRRRQAVEEEHRQRLYRASFLPAADAMTGTQFEHYVAELLRSGGCPVVAGVGGPGDGGADILATDPSGRLIAVQCKRQVAPVGVGVVRQLIGTITQEHPGRSGMLVTTAHLTKPASDLALRADIAVVDRDKLAAWMADIRDLITSPSGAAG